MGESAATARSDTALIARAQDQSQQRVVDMNRTVETNLLAIITGLATEPPSRRGCNAECGCNSLNVDREVVPDVG